MFVDFTYTLRQSNAFNACVTLYFPSITQEEAPINYPRGGHPSPCLHGASVGGALHEILTRAHPSRVFCTKCTSMHDEHLNSIPIFVPSRVHVLQRNANTSIHDTFNKLYGIFPNE